MSPNPGPQPKMAAMNSLPLFLFFFFSCAKFSSTNAFETPRGNNSSDHTHDLFDITSIPFSLWPFSLDSPSWYNIVLSLLFVFLYEKQIRGLWALIHQFKSGRNIIFVLRKVIKTLVGIALTSLLTTIISPIYILLQSIKRVIMFGLRLKFGNSLSEPVGNDAIWSTLDDIEKPLIMILLKFEGKVDLDNVKMFFDEKIIGHRLENGSRPYQKFQQTFENFYGYFMWKDVTDFDINKHVKLVDLEEVYTQKQRDEAKLKESSSCSEELVCRYLSEFGSKNIPKDIPQWEIICIKEGDKNDFTALVKLHHAIGDGISLVRLLLEVFSDTPAYVSVMGRPPHPIAKYLTSLWSMALMPFSIPFLWQGDSNPVHGKALTGKKIYVTSKAIPFGTVKALKEKTKSAATDILFSCLSASLASFFHKKELDVPRLTIVFPIGFEDPSAPLALNNTFAMGVADLPTPSDHALLDSFDLTAEGGKGKVSVRRNRVVKESFDGAKEDPTILSTYWLMALACSVLPTFLLDRMIPTRGKTIGVSNLPGPQKEVFVWKKKVLEMRFWVPDRAPTGLGFTIMSYKGEFRVSFNADEALIATRDEAHEIIDGFVTALSTFETEVNSS